MKQPVRLPPAAPYPSANHHAAPTANQTPWTTLGRYFYFAGLGYCESMAYEAPAVLGQAALTTRRLRLHFKAQPDAVGLVLDRAQLLPGWVGTYSLRCQASPGAPVRASFGYQRGAALAQNTNWLGFSACASELVGGVTITAYDPQRLLLSGHYEVRAPEQCDPTHTLCVTSPRCTIVLAGDFTALRVQVVEAGHGPHTGRS